MNVWIGSRGSWVLVRQPLLLVFYLGCVVSIAASGRVAPRLVLDGAISFAFLPIAEGVAFAAVYARRRRALPFAPAVDRFFLTNAPWLAAMMAVAVLTIVQTPVELGR